MLPSPGYLAASSGGCWRWSIHPVQTVQVMWVLCCHSYTTCEYCAWGTGSSLLYCLSHTVSPHCAVNSSYFSLVSYVWYRTSVTVCAVAFEWSVAYCLLYCHLLTVTPAYTENSTDLLCMWCEHFVLPTTATSAVLLSVLKAADAIISLVHDMRSCMDSEYRSTYSPCWPSLCNCSIS